LKIEALRDMKLAALREIEDGNCEIMKLEALREIEDGSSARD
jgi:hypothetical protein